MRSQITRKSCTLNEWYDKWLRIHRHTYNIHIVTLFAWMNIYLFECQMNFELILICLWFVIQANQLIIINSVDFPFNFARTIVRQISQHCIIMNNKNSTYVSMYQFSVLSWMLWVMRIKCMFWFDCNWYIYWLNWEVQL